MKQYLLLLKSGDFVKSGNTWTTGAINLYANNQYINYSNVRSQYGLNLIGDRTFVGTEVTSPRGDGRHATPLVSHSLYTTDYGEVIYEQATPSLRRFVDTTSRIDVLSYRHVFTNIPGNAYPSFNMQMYESDSANGPWLKSVFTSDSTAIFNRNTKPFIKIELDIFSDGLDLSTIGLVFYLEIGIHDPVPNILSTSTKDILRRFPSWTYLYEDSVAAATPELATPKSTGGKFLNALVQESLDQAEEKLELYSINSFISTADLDQVAWCYITTNINANINLIYGNDIQLARVSSIAQFFNSRPTDYVYYYNPIDRQVLTLRLFNQLKINNTTVEQEPVNVFNDFDEFGARVGLPRLYLESNENYKKRILDVSINQPSSSIEGFKKTVRRELDLWRAYGSTPDSNYVGATPIVLEISDIENSTPFFDANNVPQKAFKTFVDNINERFPSNLGYVKWQETVWDYGGLESEGLGRLTAQYDTEYSHMSAYYQSGVGDLDDLKVVLNPSDSATVNFSGLVKISGYSKAYSGKVYAPVIVDYSWYITYQQVIADHNASRARAAVVYEIDMPPHDNYATPSTFYANLNYNTNEYFTVANNYLSTNSASPEYHLIRVFDQEGLSTVEFRDKIYNSPYLNTGSATPGSSKISIFDANTVRVVFKRTWNQSSQSYQAITTDSFKFAYNEATPVWTSSPTAGSSLSASSPSINYINSNFLIGSNLYPTKAQTFATSAYSNSVTLNSKNDISATSGATINTIDLKNGTLLPLNATPNSIYINIIKPENLSLFGEEEVSELNGGRALDGESNTLYLVPSSPYIQSSLGGYFESATINYSSAPSTITLQTSALEGPHYPFVMDRYLPFSAQTTPNIFSGFIDENNNSYKNFEEKINSFFNKDTHVHDILVSKASFGMSNNINYTITDIDFAATPNSIVVTTKSTADLIEQLNSNLDNSIPTSIPIHAEKDHLINDHYSIGIGSGWTYFEDEDYYMYYDPVVQTSTGRYFEIDLVETPKNGAPVIVSVGATPYRSIVFEDSSTPGHFSFYNTEVVKANSSELFLAYENIEKAVVIDSYTGKTVASNLSSSSSRIQPFNSATPHVPGRNYEVVYYVRNAFHVEKDAFNSSTNTYASTLHLSTTPSSNQVYKVTYESSQSNKPKLIDLDINQAENPLIEGFIYASVTDYDFSHIDAHLSPKVISDTRNDYMSLAIVSYDQNNNLKPGQTFMVSGSLVSATPQYVTTNQNGFGKTMIRYSGAIPSSVDRSTITITGIGSSTPNGGQNSVSQGYVTQMPFSIARTMPFDLELKVVPFRYNISADESSKNTVVGQIYWREKPLAISANVTWGKARSLYDLFKKTGTYVNGGTVTTDSFGRLEVPNAIVANNSQNPGYWFGYFELDTTSIIAALTSQGQINSSHNVTIFAGDVIYWHEEYDNVHFVNEYAPLPNMFISEKQIDAELIATPNFVYRHYDQDLVKYMGTTPTWSIPKWVPLRRYDQYQLGRFGATPYYISSYSLMHPDSKED